MCKNKIIFLNKKEFFFEGGVFNYFVNHKVFLNSVIYALSPHS